ncbi:unnamed protein product [Closterium sp. Naga37s-1]|nr:unnamed protein product [Closterium sp. Naga37s-1]
MRLTVGKHFGYSSIRGASSTTPKAILDAALRIDWNKRIAATNGEKRGGEIRCGAADAAAAPAFESEETECTAKTNLSLEEAEGEVAIALIEEGFALAGAFNIADYVPWLSYWDPLRMYARAQRLAPQLHGFMRACIVERRELVLQKKRTEESRSETLAVSATQTPSTTEPVVKEPKELKGMKGHETALVDTLFEIEGEGEDHMDKDEMLMLAVDMMMAGTDTTSKTVEWALAELAQHPDMLETLRAEVDAAYARRGCLGTNLGLDLSARLLANFVLRFDFKLPEDVRAGGGMDMTETFGLTMALAKPLRMVLRERKVVAGAMVAALGA